MHTFFSFFLFWTCVMFLFFLSLSFLNRYSSWHPNRRNPLQLGTLVVVPGHHLLLFLLFHLIFGSMMRRPRWTSLRTSRPVAFIWNARSFDWISPTLCYLMSFGLGDGNLYVRNPCVVLSCLYRSSTPTCTTLITLCLSSCYRGTTYP